MTPARYRVRLAVGLLLWGVGSNDLRAADQPNASPTRLVVALKDGSRLVGNTATRELPVRTETLGDLKIPMAQLEYLDIDDTNLTASVVLRNGDRIRGQLPLRKLELATVFGAVTIPLQVIARIQAAGGERSVERGLILRYGFDQEDGDVVADQGPHRHDGAVHGAEIVQSGGRGWVCRFDGSTDYIEVANADFIEKIQDEVSMALWIKIAPAIQTKTLNFPHLVSKGATHSHLFSDFSFGISRAGGLAWQYANANNQPATVESDQPISKDAWHHVAATFGKGAIKLYVDGELQAAKTGPYESLRRSGQPLYIGCRYPEPLLDGFKGLIDDIRLWDRVLSDREVLALDHD